MKNTKFQLLIYVDLNRPDGFDELRRKNPSAIIGKNRSRPIFAELSRARSISYDSTATTPRVLQTEQRSQISFFSLHSSSQIQRTESIKANHSPITRSKIPRLDMADDNLLELPIALPTLISLCITGSAFAWTRGILETR